jgi:hypothetical protein
MEKRVRKQCNGRSFKPTALVIVGWASFIMSHCLEGSVVTILLSAIARVLP